MDLFASLKRRTYTVILVVGLTGAAIAWLANELVGTITPFTRGVFLLVVALTGAALWCLASQKLPVRVVEETISVVISGVMLAVLIYALYGESNLRQAEVSLFSLHLWFPLVFIFIFLAHESAAALVRSGILYALSVGVSLPAVLTATPSRSPLEAPNTLGLSFISMASIIAVLYFLTRMKDQLRRSEIAADRMKQLADTDPLTEILNRRGFKAIMEHEIDWASRQGTPLSLIVFDLDNFKQVNDAYGHDVGDDALVQVARLIEPHLRSSDSFARWGGEEFAILAPGTPLDAAHQLADRLRTILNQHEAKAGWNLSASFGVTALTARDSGPTLAKRADVALYRAKRQGKNRTEINAAGAVGGLNEVWETG